MGILGEVILVPPLWPTHTTPCLCNNCFRKPQAKHQPHINYKQRMDATLCPEMGKLQRSDQEVRCLPQPMRHNTEVESGKKHEHTVEDYD